MRHPMTLPVRCIPSPVPFMFSLTDSTPSNPPPRTSAALRGPSAPVPRERPEDGDLYEDDHVSLLAHTLRIDVRGPLVDPRNCMMLQLSVPRTGSLQLCRHLPTRSLMLTPIVHSFATRRLLSSKPLLLRLRSGNPLISPSFRTHCPGSRLHLPTHTSHPGSL